MKLLTIHPFAIPWWLIVAVFAVFLHADANTGYASISLGGFECGRDPETGRAQYGIGIIISFWKSLEDAYGETGILIPNSWNGASVESTDPGGGPLYISGTLVEWVEDATVTAKLESLHPSGTDTKWVGFRTTALIAPPPEPTDARQTFEIASAPPRGVPTTMTASLTTSAPGAGETLQDCTIDEYYIPTVSEWGLIVLTLLLLTAGTIVVGRQRHGPVSA